MKRSDRILQRVWHAAEWLGCWIAIFMAAGMWAAFGYLGENPAVMIAALVVAATALLCAATTASELRLQLRLLRAEKEWEKMRAVRPRDRKICL